MKQVAAITALFCVTHFCGAQDARIVGASELERFISRETDTIDVINFWATWCGPCIKELPLFEKITQEGPQNVKVTVDMRLAIASLTLS